MANSEEAPVDEPVDKVVGLRGDLVNMPSGRWHALVDEDGNLVKRDGHLVKVRD